MTTPRGMSLLVQPDQWARCAHTGTALLPGGGVELTWDDPATVAPGRACGPDCAGPGSCQHRSDTAAAGSWPAPAGLAFDRWCRAYRSRPADGRVDVIGDLAPAPPAPPASATEAAGSRPCAGGLRSPAGLAVDRRDRLYIAETGAGAVHVVDLWAERVLRKVPLRGGRPLDVAADCGRAVVLTDEPGLVLVTGRRGPQPGPELVRPCYPVGLVARRVAPGPLVLWRAQDGSGAVARPDGTVLVELADPTDLDIGPDSLLVVGVRPGRPLRRFQLDGDLAIELEPVEALGYDGGAVAVAPNGRIAFTTPAGYGWTSGSAARFVPDGRVLTYRLDSGNYLTRWGRLFLDACLPPGTRLGVRFVTTDDDTVLDPTPPSPPARGSRSLPDPQATPPLAPIHLLAAAPRTGSPSTAGRPARSGPGCPTRTTMTSRPTSARSPPRPAAICGSSSSCTAPDARRRGCRRCGWSGQGTHCSVRSPARGPVWRRTRHSSSACSPPPRAPSTTSMSGRPPAPCW